MGVLETLEFTITGIFCMLLFVHYSNGVKYIYGCNKYVLIFAMFMCLFYIFFVSKNYWNMNPDKIGHENEEWSSIIIAMKAKKKVPMKADEDLLL